MLPVVVIRPLPAEYVIELWSRSDFRLAEGTATFASCVAIPQFSFPSTTSSAHVGCVQHCSTGNSHCAACSPFSLMTNDHLFQNLFRAKQTCMSALSKKKE